MSNKSNLIILLNIVVLTLFVAFSIKDKENTLENGQLILLRLAPVDPRSLMQGDYMVLNYEVSDAVPNNIPNKGYLIFTKDSLENFTPNKWSKEPSKKSDQTISLKYQLLDTWGTKTVKLGAESYFFEEGQAEKFEAAKFGGLKVDAKGNSILIGLYDENKQLIK